MLTMMNNPPRWLAKALAIVEGLAAPAITTEAHQVVDIMQGGLGQGVFGSQQNIGSLGGAQVSNYPVVPDPDAAYLVRVSATNNGTANSLLSISLVDPGSVSVLSVFIANVPSATTYGWWSTTVAGLRGIGGGQQWFYVPPGYTLTVQQGQYVTTVGQTNVQWCRVPAGAKAW